MDPQTSSPGSPCIAGPGATPPSPPSAPTPAVASSPLPRPPNTDGSGPPQQPSPAISRDTTVAGTAGMVASLAAAAAKEASLSAQVLVGAASLVAAVDVAAAPAVGRWKPLNSGDDAMDVDPRLPPTAGDRALMGSQQQRVEDWSHFAGWELFPPPPPRGSGSAAGAGALAVTTEAAGALTGVAASGSLAAAAGSRTPPPPASLPSGSALLSLPPQPSPPAPWSMATGPWIGLNGEPLSPTVVAQLPGAPSWLARRPPLRGRPPQSAPFPRLSQSVAEAASSTGVSRTTATTVAERGGQNDGSRPRPLPGIVSGGRALHWYSGDLDALLPPLMSNADRLVRVVTAVMTAAGTDPASISVLLNADKAAEFVRDTELSFAVVGAVIERRAYIPYSVRQLLAEGAARGDTRVPATSADVDLEVDEEWRNLTSTAAEAVRLVAFPLAALPRSVAEAVVPRPPSVTAVTNSAAAADQNVAWVFFAPPAADGGPPAAVPQLEMALELLLSCPSVTPDGVLGALVLAARARRANAVLVLSPWTMGRLLVAATATVVIQAGDRRWVVADELRACGLLDPAADLVRLVNALQELLNGSITVTAREVETMDEMIRVRAVQLGMGKGGQGKDDTPAE